MKLFEQAQAEEPLSFPARLLFMVFAFTIVPARFFGGMFRLAGYERKYRDTWMWTLYGGLMWFVIIMTLIFTNNI